LNRKTSLLAFELLTATDPKTESSDGLQDIAFVVLFGRIKFDVKSDVMSGVLVAMVVVMSGAEEQNGFSIHWDEDISGVIIAILLTDLLSANDCLICGLF
jgi:hypothetical protein